MNTNPDDWQIKPEPVYEWQWVVHFTEGDRFQLTDYMIEDEVNGANYIVERYEPSKRERK